MSEATLTQIASTERVTGHQWNIDKNGVHIRLHDGSGEIIVERDDTILFRFGDGDVLLELSPEFFFVLTRIWRTLRDPNRSNFAIMEPW